MNSGYPMDAVQAWADATRSCAEATSKTWWTMASSAADFWAMPAATFVAASEAASEVAVRADKKSASRSWYRKPAESPLDLMMSLFAPANRSADPFGWFAAQPSGFAWSQPSPPFPWYSAAAAWPATPNMIWSPFPAPAFDVNRVWSAMQMAMAMAPYQKAVADAAAQLASNEPVFSSYRSEGGHAVAQIAMRTMAALIPMMFAMGMLLGSMQPNYAA